MMNSSRASTSSNTSKVYNIELTGTITISKTLSSSKSDFHNNPTSNSISNSSLSNSSEPSLPSTDNHLNSSNLPKLLPELLEQASGILSRIQSLQEQYRRASIASTEQSEKTENHSESAEDINNTTSSTENITQAEENKKYNMKTEYQDQFNNKWPLLIPPEQRPQSQEEQQISRKKLKKKHKNSSKGSFKANKINHINLASISPDECCASRRFSISSHTSIDSNPTTRLLKFELKMKKKDAEYKARLELFERKHTQNLIKSISSQACTRYLSNTAISLLTDNPATFHSGYGSKNLSNPSSAFLSDHYLFTNSICPEMYPNHPITQQSYSSAIRAKVLRDKEKRIGFKNIKRTNHDCFLSRDRI